MSESGEAIGSFCYIWHSSQHYPQINTVDAIYTVTYQLMKKNYVKPEMKVANVEMCSIIATSGAGGTIPDAPFLMPGLDGWE